MKRQVSLLLLVLAVTVVAGCSSSGKPRGLAAPGLTKEEVDLRHQEAIRNDFLQIQDDIDAIFMFNRPGRRSRMMIR